MLGVLQIAEEEHAQDDGDDQGQVQVEGAQGEGDHVRVVGEAGELGSGGIGVQEEVPASLGLPQELEEIEGDVVEHQGQQGLPAAPRGKGHPHVVKDRLGRRRGIGRFRRPVGQRPLRHVFILRSGHFSHCPFSRFLL